jgi:hypothetical protein
MADLAVLDLEPLAERAAAAAIPATDEHGHAEHETLLVSTSRMRHLRSRDRSASPETSRRCRRRADP